MAIQLSCPSCRRTMRLPDSAAGRSITCPHCRTAMDVQAAGAEPIYTPVPVDERITRNSQVPAAVVPLPPPPEPFDFDTPEPSRPVRRRNHDGYTGFICPYCGSSAPPRTHRKISTAGWVMFILLLLVICLPLCWIGLLITEEYRLCADCGMKLG